MKYRLKCISCAGVYEPDQILYTCPRCGDRLGTLEIVYTYSQIKVKRSDFDKYSNIWQFEKVLPVNEGSYRTPLHVGGTPLYSFKGWSGFQEVLVKYDGSNPTASYKDRASAVAITKAYENGFDNIYCASTGNAASSLAGLTAATSLNTYIFLPASAPIAKISQLFVFGAKVVPVDGSYDQAFDISLKVGAQKGWYCRNSAINPYLLEGKKTGAMEIIVQNNWQVPDAVLVGVGDGTVISSFYKGFYDFFQLGLIDRIPKIIGVQAKGSDSIKRVFDKGEPYSPDDIEARTIADSISVGKPRDVIKACKFVKASGGFFITVEDDQILQAIRELATETGIFGEPAGAVTYAGLKEIRKKNLLDSKSSVCIVVTGNGLKDVKAVERFVEARPVAPNEQDVLKYLEKF